MKFDDFPWPAMGERKLVPTWEDGRFIVDSEPFEDLLKEIPQAAIVGADYLPNVVLRAARRVRSAPFLQFDLRNCPLAGDCLDGVTALNVLEHIDDDFTALREIQRILKRGGLAHLEVPADPSSFDLYDEVLMHFRRYRLRDLTTKARDAGFAILKAPIWAFPFIRSSNSSSDVIK